MHRFIITTVVISVLGGLIAYLGNQLGRYIGRQKLSILHLRPRHTSILITSLTGAFIAAATLTFAYASSQEVRILFAGLEKFRDDVVTKTVKTIEQSEIGGVVFRQREPILTAVIDGTKSREEVLEQLGNVMVYVNEAAIQRNRDMAETMGTKFTLPADGKLAGYVPEELELLSKVISEKKGKYVVLVFPSNYVFYGEKFVVGFYTVEYIPKVFAAGDVVVSENIPGTLSREEIFTNLSKLLVKAKVAALRNGMIENPVTYKLIEINKGDFLKAVDSLYSSKRSGTVNIKARKDTDSRGPLDVYIEIE